MIPKPSEIKSLPGFLEINNRFLIRDYLNNNQEMMEVLRAQFATLLDFKVVTGETEEPHVVIEIKKGDDNNSKVGSYRLVVESNKIVISSANHAGVFYAFQSLIQLLAEHKNTAKLPCMELNDSPRYLWRGLLFDSSRTFYPVPVIKKVLDQMALLKLNVFHWHLTDDQGWRVPIKKYPKLTAGKDHYLESEIKEIIAYAKARSIEVMPEIDMPGHFSAVLSAYPHIGCTDEEMEVPEHFGVFKTIACGGKETTYEFVKDVLDEVCALFPYEYIHLGGDEARKDRWDECPHCQQKIKEENLNNSEELQGYFMNRIFQYLMDEKAKKVVGWNENLHAANLDERLVIQHWYDGSKKKNSKKALNEGREMIISDTAHVYFDYPYCVTPLKKVYNFAPYFDQWSKDNIKGIEGAVWTEFIRDEATFEQMVYPRMHALAEVGWTKRNSRDYQDFHKRLTLCLDLLEQQKITYTKLNDADIPWFKARLQEISYRRRMDKIHKRFKEMNK